MEVIHPVSSVHLFSFKIKYIFSKFQLAATRNYVGVDLRATNQKKNVKVC